ncbi:Oxidative stress-induced growth inhibitor 1 [Stylophora pistillata]|uniref:Oxidative stress-induced growth inhibitor 1 n=1 Tax=Stylophora pistillata TaxID=50429 RepID=A0A2B4RU75_STYPI|nr:Oxidative stress-induced growth inhibitor 1 [Stylophora pistillata]
MSLNSYEDDYEVVVIGNGPSALSLSYLLSGNVPYYIPHQHPNVILDQKLCEEPGKSLLDVDLEYLSEGLEGRSLNPVALLFDQLLRPNADLGKDQDSCLKWHYSENRAVKHLVMGSGQPGGSWHHMQGSQLTLSLNNWLELPGCDFQDWLRAHRSSTVRKPCNLVTNGDCTNCHCRMSSIPREGCWEIQGVKGTFPNMPEFFVVHAYNVVLATGNNVPKLLGIPGENLPFVCHKMDQIDSYLDELSEVAHSMDPCLVVGAGLSAADCVLALRNKGVPVIHVVRRNGNDPKIIYNQLPGVVYPEYYKVGQMIKGEVTTAYGKDSSYVAYTKTTLVEIRKDKECILKKADGTLFKLKVSNVFVLVGAVPDLSFLPDINKNELGSNPAKKIDSKENPININPFTYETVLEPGLFAVGPLIGDNFVRFGIGGALGIANHLMREEE